MKYKYCFRKIIRHLKYIYSAFEAKIISTPEEMRKKCDGCFGFRQEKIIADSINKNRKRLQVLLLGVIVLVLVSIVKPIFGNGQYTVNHKGSVVKINRDLAEEYESFPLIINSKESKEKVSINFSKEKSDNLAEKKDKKDDKYYINQVISEIEQSTGNVIALPSKLENGHDIQWTVPRDNSTATMLFLMLVLIVLMYKERYKGILKKKKKYSLQVRRQLPSFLNKLLLTMESGATFADSVAIASKAKHKGREDFFQSNMTLMVQKSEENGENLLMLINDFAIKTEVKDFVRLTSIMAENQHKGGYLLDKLLMERKVLWLNRKRLAEEQGKIAETKLVIPMTLLLMVLIVVTAAPAFLQI